jgi:hypothetical protein
VVDLRLTPGLTTNRILRSSSYNGFDASCSALTAGDESSGMTRRRTAAAGNTE